MNKPEKQRVTKVKQWVLARSCGVIERDNKQEPRYDYPEQRYSRLKFSYYAHKQGYFIYSDKVTAELALKKFKKEYPHHSKKMVILERSLYRGYSYNIIENNGEWHVTSELTINSERKDFEPLLSFLNREIVDANNEIKDYNKRLLDEKNKLNHLTSLKATDDFNKDLAELLNEET